MINILISVLIFLLISMSCSLRDQSEVNDQDVNQITRIILMEADSYAQPHFRGAKKFGIHKLDSSDRDIQRILATDWTSDSENPKEREWEVLAREAANIKNDRLPFKINLFEDFHLILIDDYEMLDNKQIRGIISISDLAFNEDRSRAVIYVSFICGGECGFGTLYFFSKIEGEWMKFGENGFWIS